MSISSDNKKISIPDSLYVGFSVRNGTVDLDEPPLGFLVPDGKDAGAQKRKATVDQWAKNTKNPIPSQTFENKPLVGFSFGRSIRHSGAGWGQGLVKFRIFDPRGFELEITGPNVCQIMLCTTIEGGEINDPCVWARMGAQNVLLPITSDVYKAAMANTSRMSKTASLRDIRPGYHVTLQNGVEGIYLGQHFKILKNEYTLTVEVKKRYIVGIIDAYGQYESFHESASLKLSTFEERTPLSASESEQIINDNVIRLHESRRNSSGLGYNCVGVVATNIKAQKKIMVKCDVVKNNYFDNYFIELKDGSWGEYNPGHARNYTKIGVRIWDQKTFANNNTIIFFEENVYSHSIFSRGHYQHRSQQKEIDKSEIAQHFKLNYQIETNDGNVYTFED